MTFLNDMKLRGLETMPGDRFRFHKGIMDQIQ